MNKIPVIALLAVAAIANTPASAAPAAVNPANAAPNANLPQWQIQRAIEDGKLQGGAATTPTYPNFSMDENLVPKWSLGVRAPTAVTNGMGEVQKGLQLLCKYAKATKLDALRFICSGADLVTSAAGLVNNLESYVNTTASNVTQDLFDQLVSTANQMDNSTPLQWDAQLKTLNTNLNQAATRGPEDLRAMVRKTSKDWLDQKLGHMYVGDPTKPAEDNVNRLANALAISPELRADNAVVQNAISETQTTAAEASISTIADSDAIKALKSDANRVGLAKSFDPREPGYVDNHQRMTNSVSTREGVQNLGLMVADLPGFLAKLNEITQDSLDRQLIATANTNKQLSTLIQLQTEERRAKLAEWEAAVDSQTKEVYDQIKEIHNLQKLNMGTFEAVNKMLPLAPDPGI